MQGENEQRIASSQLKYIMVLWCFLITFFLLKKICLDVHISRGHRHKEPHDLESSRLKIFIICQKMYFFLQLFLDNYKICWNNETTKSSIVHTDEVFSSVCWWIIRSFLYLAEATLRYLLTNKVTAQRPMNKQRKCGESSGELPPRGLGAEQEEYAQTQTSKKNCIITQPLFLFLMDCREFTFNKFSPKVAKIT